MSISYDPDTVYDVISDIIRKRFSEDEFQALLDLNTEEIDGIKYGRGEILRERTPNVFMDCYGRFLAEKVGKAFAEPSEFDMEYGTHISAVLHGGEQ